MKTSKQLKEERALLVTEQDALTQTVKTEKRDFKPEEETRFDDLQTKIKAFEPQIKRAEQIEENETRSASAAGSTVGESESREKAKMVKKYSLHKALRSQLPNGNLDGVELEYHQEMVKEARNAGVAIEGIAIPNGAEKRAAGQTVTADAGAYGAALVDTQFKGVIDALRATPLVVSLGAKYMRGLTGDAKFVTNGGGIAATWETEVATTAATKNAYGTKTMTPKRLSCTVPISLQNILQSTPDLELFTANDIKKLTEIAIDTAVINGAGSGGVPEGILQNADITVLTGATNGIAPSWAQLIQMETSVLAANAAGMPMYYLITPGLAGLLKQTAHAGSGNWNYLMDRDGSVNGYKSAVSTLVPSNLTKGTGTNLHAAIFGDFSNCLIGEWGFYDMVVDNITQKKSGLIEITVNQFVDVLIRQGAAFAASKDFIV